MTIRTNVATSAARRYGSRRIRVGQRQSELRRVPSRWLPAPRRTCMKDSWAATGLGQLRRRIASAFTALAAAPPPPRCSMSILTRTAQCINACFMSAAARIRH